MNTAVEGLRTPLYQIHCSSGARMVDFHGWQMPVQYTSIIEEHKAVRCAVGLFDISHMGKVEVCGKESSSFLQTLITNNLSKLYPGKALYSPMCNFKGGIVDDLILYMFTPENFILVLNASNTRKDIDWMTGLKKNRNVNIQDCSKEWALLAIQGPMAIKVVKKGFRQDFDGLKRFHFVTSRFEGTEVIISRTGYTGEDGFEIFVPAYSAVRLWEVLMDAGKDEGIVPCGLGARDTLRMEAGYVLYGNDIDESTDPFEAGLGWTVDMSKSSFIGKDALVEIREKGIRKRLIRFRLLEKGVPRQGCRIMSLAGKEVGYVTSGGFSGSKGCGIGMGYVDVDILEGEIELGVDIRGRIYRMEVE